MANALQPASNKAEAFGSVNWYGAAPNNSNRQSVPFTNYVQTQDATTPINLVSPLAVLVGAVTPLVIPQNAVTVTLISSAAVAVSELAGTTSLTQYFTVPANTPVTLNVARQLNLYLLGAATVSFYFAIL